MQIDHVLYGVRDLAEAESWFADSFQLHAAAGGTHAAWGTGNLILPVGEDQYIELISVVEPDSEHPLAHWLTAMVKDGDRPVGICLRPEDLDATARRLAIDVMEAERVSPAGDALRWRMAGLQSAVGPERLPFFIEWPGRRGNPELADAVVSSGSGIAWAEVGGDAGRLRDWVGGDTKDLAVVEGDAGISQFAIHRDGGLLVIAAR